MVYCIGVDEAGYGPRLGPLVISATLWQLPDGLPPEQMYQRLCRVITPNPSGRRKPDRFRSRNTSPLPSAGEGGQPAGWPDEGDNFPLPSAGEGGQPAGWPGEGESHCPVAGNDTPGHLPTENAAPLGSAGLLQKIPQDLLPLLVADSKLVYTRQGRAGLERTVLAMLAAAGRLPAHWTDLVQTLAFDPESRQDALTWYPDYWPKVPESLSASEIAQLAGWVAGAMAKQGIRLLGLRSMLLFPERFNRLVSQYGNKATMLSCQSLELVKGLLAALPAGPVWVLCDKHGGRDKYEHLLCQIFDPSFEAPGQLGAETRLWPLRERSAETKAKPGEGEKSLPKLLCPRKRKKIGNPSSEALLLWQSVPVKPVQESRRQSIYQLQTPHGPMEFRFLCGGEVLMPVALASMLSKYLRELAMEAWNRFWAEQVPGIQPTAGYPKDARRFHAEIAQRQAALGIADSTIWRTR